VAAGPAAGAGAGSADSLVADGRAAARRGAFAAAGAAVVDVAGQVRAEGGSARRRADTLPGDRAGRRRALRRTGERRDGNGGRGEPEQANHLWSPPSNRSNSTGTPPISSSGAHRRRLRFLFCRSFLRFSRSRFFSSSLMIRAGWPLIPISRCRATAAECDPLPPAGG